MNKPFIDIFGISHEPEVVIVDHPKPRVPSVFEQYAESYGVTYCEAVADRDWPMNAKECVEAFKKDHYRTPTDDELYLMRPDRDEVAEQVRDEFEADYYSIYDCIQPEIRL